MEQDYTATRGRPEFCILTLFSVNKMFKKKKYWYFYLNEGSPELSDDKRHANTYHSEDGNWQENHNELSLLTVLTENG